MLDVYPIHLRTKKRRPSSFLNNKRNFEGKALNSYYARKAKMASKIIFKKVFTFYFLCDIIRFARARFSDFGVNLNQGVHLPLSGSRGK